jgi:hypothetical protein
VRGLSATYRGYETGTKGGGCGEDSLACSSLLEALASLVHPREEHEGTDWFLCLSLGLSEPQRGVLILFLDNTALSSAWARGWQPGGHQQR